VKDRLQRLENRNKLQDTKAPDRPTLRTRTERQPTTTAGGQQPTSGGNEPPAEDPDRPKLERRDDPNKQ
jgi:hypothetical protein